MKKISVLAILLFSLTAATIKTTTEVYICKGKGSKRYHFSPNCRGLNSCTTKIYKVSKSEARKIGRTICGWED
ncbi:hypothetical protein [Aquimarina agarilytica]|uniref:hypothetical protein n=1 Tax=Aquimarina agarilytica TaxID=1087449 RepID=UPI000288DEC0|nr:hypothetical protein [Aquimarina agarilytica]